MCCVAQQIAAVEHGNDLHAGRQDAVIELVDFLVNGIECGLLFRAFAHAHHTLNDIRLIDNAPILQVVGSGHVAQPDFWSLGHLRDVLHPKRRARLVF